jgi:hypothetical protein
VIRRVCLPPRLRLEYRHHLRPVIGVRIEPGEPSEPISPVLLLRGFTVWF